MMLAMLFGGGCERAPSPSAPETDPQEATVSNENKHEDSIAPESSDELTDDSYLSSRRDASPTEDDALVRLDLPEIRERDQLDDLPTTEVTIERDPVYEETRSYRGWPLESFLEATTDLNENARSDLELQFVATDGYRATVALAEAPLERAVVAFEDLDAPDGRTWATFRHGKEETTPGPFYVVWRGADDLEGHLPWAFKVTSIRMASYREMYGEAYPADHPEARERFAIFKRQCIRCHGINLRGRAVGPELNVPRNVTEYWPDEHLRQFILQASSYHAGTKMPSFEGNLDDPQLDALIAYLEAMASEKVCETAEGCAERLQ